MVPQAQLGLLGTHVDYADGSIIAAVGDVLRVRGETDVGDSDTSCTQRHLLYHITIRCSCHCYRTTILAACRQDHIIVTPGEGRDFLSLVRLVNERSWHAVIDLVDEHL